MISVAALALMMASAAVYATGQRKTRRPLTYPQIALVSFCVAVVSAIGLVFYLYLNTSDLIGSLQVTGPISLLILLTTCLAILVNRPQIDDPEA